jgi:glycosyltransferase involved in cell wall biosynthesis
MKVLALEGYYGGSHKAFLDGWVAHSRHEWTVLTLAPNKWKWRMRHGAVTFAQQVNDRIAQGEKWDVIFCCDMLNLAEFAGLVDRWARDLPRVVYFHENQLTYPVRFESERDYQYVMTNLTTAIAADRVWFNSAFHRDEFLSALGKFLKRMPDNQPLKAIEDIRAKSAIHPPGIYPFAPGGERKEGPVRILWAGRWEHDKNPEDFFAAMKILKEKGLDFRLSVIGERFRDVPEVFEWAREFFAGHIERWGYQESIEEYRAALMEADIVVSTANHEFFGISIVEAIAAGAYPVLPKRLAYPEIVAGIESASQDEFFYDGTVKGLAEKIMTLMETLDQQDKAGRIKAMDRYGWRRCADEMDDALTEVIG